MDIASNNQISFRAKFAVSALNEKYKNGLKNVCPIFEEMTKEHTGRLSLVEDLNNKRYIFRLGRGHIYEIIQRPQTGYPSKEWLSNFMALESDKEKAGILAKIFETLQLIPKQYDKKWADKEFRTQLLNKINENLGDDNYNISHMFEPIGQTFQFERFC